MSIKLAGSKCTMRRPWSSGSFSSNYKRKFQRPRATCESRMASTINIQMHANAIFELFISILFYNFAKILFL